MTDDRVDWASLADIATPDVLPAAIRAELDQARSQIGLFLDVYAMVASRVGKDQALAYLCMSVKELGKGQVRLLAVVLADEVCALRQAAEAKPK